MEPEKIDWDKPIQTVDGRRAKYVHTLEGGYGYPHVVVIATRKDRASEEVVLADDKGRSWHDDDNVINVPQRHVRWVNLYPQDSRTPGCSYGTRESADRSAGSHRIACIRIEFEEGEGL